MVPLYKKNTCEPFNSIFFQLLFSVNVVFSKSILVEFLSTSHSSAQIEYALHCTSYHLKLVDTSLVRLMTVYFIVPVDSHRE